MLGEKLGHVFDKPLEKLAAKIPLNPNTITVTGFLITLAGAYVLISDLRSGGLIVLAGGLFDMFDGIVARINSKTTSFGAFLDSVLDRISDAIIFIAIALNLLNKTSYTGALLATGTMVGAFLVSYTRARAEGLGKKCNVGLMERPERIILISFGAITGLIIMSLWVLVALTWFTVFQRIFYVRTKLQE